MDTDGLQARCICLSSAAGGDWQGGGQDDRGATARLCVVRGLRGAWCVCAHGRGAWAWCVVVAGEQARGRTMEEERGDREWLQAVAVGSVRDGLAYERACANDAASGPTSVATAGGGSVVKSCQSLR